MSTHVVGSQLAPRPPDTATAEAELLQLLNAERARAGRAPIQSHPRLVSDARGWSNLMAEQDQMFHSPNAREDTTRSVPGLRRWGENVAYGWNPESIHRQLVNSPTHYANMIGDFNWVGIGVTYTPQRSYVTYRFAKTDQLSPEATRVSADVATAQVRRLYLAFFQREPDAVGRAFWVNQLLSGHPLGQVAAEFVKSNEFRSTYGGLTDTQFVELVYRNVLGRDPDPDGFDYWVGQLRRGMGRGSLMVNFSESAEFKAKT